MRFASFPPGNWSMATAGRIPEAGSRTTPGFCVRRIFHRAFPPRKTPGTFPRVCGTFKERAGWHGCQMPEQLLGRIIARAVPGEPGKSADLVLDPFAGSGTTLAVAKKLGRRYLGFELSSEYAKQVQDRLAAIHVNDPLDGAAEPLIRRQARPKAVSWKT